MRFYRGIQLGVSKSESFLAKNLKGKSYKPGEIYVTQYLDGAKYYSLYGHGMEGFIDEPFFPIVFVLDLEEEDFQKHLEIDTTDVSAEEESDKIEHQKLYPNHPPASIGIQEEKDVPYDAWFTDKGQVFRIEDILILTESGTLIPFTKKVAQDALTHHNPSADDYAKAFPLWKSSPNGAVVSEAVFAKPTAQSLKASVVEARHALLKAKLLSK